MIVYDTRTKVLSTELFPQHNIVYLNFGITFIALFSQGGAFTVSTHTHTYTHTTVLNMSGSSRFLMCQPNIYPMSMSMILF